MGVGVARLGVDVALITVQVEIVRAIDCASKCYTSHLSTFSLFFLLLSLKKSTPLVKTLIACKFTETTSLDVIMTMLLKSLISFWFICLFDNKNIIYNNEKSFCNLCYFKC